MTIALYCLAAYLAFGICFTIWFYEPEADGWLWQILLWPFWIAAYIRNG